MKQNNFGELIFNESDVCDLLMQGRNPASLNRMIVDSSINIEQMVDFVDRMPEFIKHVGDPTVNMTVFDQRAQARWHMPEEYKQVDIAEYILVSIEKVKRAIEIRMRTLTSSRFLSRAKLEEACKL
jgi:hypothetical protein